MTISAKVIADSISLHGIRLTTMQLRYPKYIHGEFMTHRVFSRNASSSRAIPVERLIQDVIDDPVYPARWGLNQKGMQAHQEADEAAAGAALQYWKVGRMHAIEAARRLHRLGIHKQVVNRVIEPYSHINVVVTATEWENFYSLRCHPDAQPEMQALANAMLQAQRASLPTVLQSGDWHLPYVTDDDWRCFPQDLVTGGDGYTYEEALDSLIKVSVARCARTSYLTHEGRTPSVDEDIALYARLVGSVPLHASPAEHQATPDTCHDNKTIYAVQNREVVWHNPELHGNLVGWRQYRKTLPGEAARDR